MWYIRKDLEKKAVSIMRFDLPYYTTPLEQWSWMLAHPEIIGKEPEHEKAATETVSDDGDFGGLGVA